MLEHGKTQEEVAQMLGVARTTVTYWLKLYCQGGEEALKVKPRGRPKGGKLLGWQAATICNIIRDRCPDQLKLPFALWTREAVQQLREEVWDKAFDMDGGPVFEALEFHAAEAFEAGLRKKS